jgi:hypothetical protein
MRTTRRSTRSTRKLKCAAGYEHLADLITDRMNDAEQKHLSKSLTLLRRLID